MPTSLPSPINSALWQKKCFALFESRGWKCDCCGGTESSLHASTAYVTPGRGPWDYPDAAYVVTCAGCVAFLPQSPETGGRAPWDGLLESLFPSGRVLILGQTDEVLQDLTRLAEDLLQRDAGDHQDILRALVDGMARLWFERRGDAAPPIGCESWQPDWLQEKLRAIERMEHAKNPQAALAMALLGLPAAIRLFQAEERGGGQ